MAKPEIKSEADAFRAAFHERMHANNMYGLWELASQMTPQPQPKMIPHMWPWSTTQSIIEESARAVPVGDERRALQLFNPGLGGRWATTNNLIAAVQILLPGEVARAHRHTPTAIRFIIEGTGAYTAVDGERVYMAPGDLILTPSWAWHDHGNETKDRVVWMDGLDIPLIASLEAMFFQFYSAPQVPVSRPAKRFQTTVWSCSYHANLGERESAIFAAPALFLGASLASAQFAPRSRGQRARWRFARVSSSANRRAGVADDGLHGSAAAAGRAYQSASPHRQRGLPRRERRRISRSSTDNVSIGAKATSSRCRPGRCTSTRIYRRARMPCCSRSRIYRCSMHSVSTTRKNSKRTTAIRK